MRAAIALLIVTLVCAISAVTAPAELQLIPRVADYDMDGVKMSRLVFSEGGGPEVTYTPPKGWVCSGATAKLTMQPKDKPQAEATITRTPLPNPTTFDEETLKKLTNDAIASIPPGSTDVQLLSSEKNHLTIGQKETFLVTMSYKLYGENYGRSLLFLNRGKEQFRFQLVSRLDDFNELEQAFLGSQFGWRNL